MIFFAVVDILEITEEYGISNQKVEAQSIMMLILSFEFVFALHLMKNILGDHKWIVNSIARKKKKKSRHSKCYGSC